MKTINVRYPEFSFMWSNDPYHAFYQQKLIEYQFDESALVPEDQFLSQHPGSSTIRVSVPNVDYGQVIEIEVQSLTESVASLKEKVAGEIQILAKKQSLIGKAGVLKDNKSLAHYNVVAGEILTLSLFSQLFLTLFNLRNYVYSLKFVLDCLSNFLSL